MVMYCPQCGAENPDSAQYCNLCLGTMGFTNIEYTDVAGSDEGYLDRYPSSFHEGAVPVRRRRERPAGRPASGRAANS